MRSVECQVQERVVFFKKGAPRLAVDGPTPRAVKAFDNENPTGSWNTVEVLCLRGTCLHAVNGRVNLALTNPRQPAAEGGTAPLTKGRLQIQTEGAEVFYRNVAIRPISEFPTGYRP